MIRRISMFLCLTVTAACGSSSPPSTETQPDAGDAPDASLADAALPARSFKIAIPATGETIGFELDGSTARVTRSPARLRLVLTTLVPTTNANFLHGTTLAAKCADFDAEPFHNTAIAPRVYGTFEFSLEFGPRSRELQDAVRAELEHRGWLPSGGVFDVRWDLPDFAPDFVWTPDARSPSIPSGNTGNPPSVAAVGQQSLMTMFDELRSTGAWGNPGLSIGVACDLANKKVVVRSRDTGKPSIAIDLIINP